jgi:hypothetical protein
MNMLGGKLVLLLAILAFAGCSHPGRKYQWQFYEDWKSLSGPELELTVDRREEPLEWDVKVGVWRTQTEHQKWSVRRADTFAGLEQGSHIWYVTIPPADGDRKPGDDEPSAAQLPEECSKAKPLRRPSRVRATDLAFLCEWRVEFADQNGKAIDNLSPPKGTLESDTIRFRPGDCENVRDRLERDRSRRAFIVVEAKPKGWEGEARSHRVELRRDELNCNPPEAKLAPKPPARGTAAKKGTTQARPPRTGGGSGQP